MKNKMSRKSTIEIVNRGLFKRYQKEKRFKRFGISAILLSLVFLAVLFTSIIGKGHSAFFQTYIKLDVYLDDQEIDIDDLISSNYQGLVKRALRENFPDVRKRGEKRKLYSLVSSGAGFQIGEMVKEDLNLIGQTITVWLVADDEVDMVMKGKVDIESPEDERKINDLQLKWLDQLKKEKKIEKKFNTILFTAGDSRNPEQAGILGAISGSFFTLVVTLLLSFPIGIATAVYLEEFAKQNRWTDIIEVNINNLAAVPSIIFGLLGLSIFLNIFSLPRSAPLVGGLVLTLMTLPTIIIAGRSALKSVPPSIRDAALGLGASKMQMVMHHVLPLAMPGMLTGTIIGMARALGETAPLLMIGMVAFIVDIPRALTDPSTALPVQIYLWADSPERAFTERTSAATLVLLGFLILMNTTAVILRKKFERKW